MKFLLPIITLIIITLPVLLSGCARYREIPAGSVKAVATSPVVEKTEVKAAPSTQSIDASPSRDYLIGANDVLFITIGKPELTIGGGAGKIQGSRVDGGGNIHLPLVGAVSVAGLTIAKAEEKIKTLYRNYFVEPWVVVEVAEYRSQPVYLLGRFKMSGTYYMDRPLTLLQGMSLGNGFEDNANLKGARLSRDGKIQPVDVYDLLTNGDASQNVWLKPGDTIYLPDNRTAQAFVFGAVKKPGPVPIPVGGLNLAQAIASVELRETGYDFNHVRIIRSLSTTRGELLVVDLEKVMRGEALPFQLQEGDVVYVPKNNFGTWNDVIADILPSLQAFSAVLQPFVNIKYLSKN